MSTYVIADIHGCYREFMQLLNRVGFDDKKDNLYVLGDIIDRGPGSEEVFEWVYERYNKNVFMCMGNHESMFCDFVNFNSCKKLSEKIMKKRKIEEFDISWVLTSDIPGKEKEILLEYYNFLENKMDKSYDKYGTIEQLLENGRDDAYLEKMKIFFEKLPYYFILEYAGKIFYLVHAYISEPVDECSEYDMIWSRAFVEGEPGIPGKVVLYGHTPTTTYHYNYEGNVKVNKQDDAITVNIDCGCCWRAPNSKLALVRLDDLKVFYSNIYKNNYVTNVL